MQTVRADDDAGPLGDRRAAGGVAADAGDPAALRDELAHGEALAHLGAGLDGRVHQDLVQHRAARRVAGGDAVGRRRRAVSANGPTSKSAGGPADSPVATTRSSRPQRSSRATPGWWM